MWFNFGVLSFRLASNVGRTNGPLQTTTRAVFVRGLKKRADNWGSRKQKRKLLEQFDARVSKNSDPHIEAQLGPLREAVKKQGDEVRKLKEASAPEAVLKQAIYDLKNLKKAFEDKQVELLPSSEDVSFERAKLELLLKQRFFYQQAFSIYGGAQGLYDFGPTGCAVKAHLLAAWRQFFINEEHMLEIESPMLTPESVLMASGHVDRFADWMVKDVKTGECFRADHLLEAGLERLLDEETTAESIKQQIARLLPTVENMKAQELHANIVKFDLRSPAGNQLTEPQQFNLMFSTSIGPSGNLRGYLRPETAQGIFVNFRKLLDFNQGRMPFAAAQVGYSFRNEISPRSGIIRVREFCMAEIEHFLDPLDKAHARFAHVADYRLPLYSASAQMNSESATEWRVGDAVEQKLIANQTLAYYLARVHQFLVKIGMDKTRMRLRQHLANEMSHYAADCWDVECETSYGWVEVVGCADRSSYDLTQHSKASGERLVAERPLSQPKVLLVLECVPNKVAIAQTFKQHSKTIIEHLSALNKTRDEAAITALRDAVLASGNGSLSLANGSFQLSKEHVQFKQVERKLHVEQYVPHVIEPSFGIGRIMYALFEHNFRVRQGDEQRTYLALPTVIAPFKCAVLPLSSNALFEPYVRRVSQLLSARGVPHRIDDSGGSIGRRYARTDQIAIPFAITIDFETSNKQGERFETVTLRERDSMRQVRGSYEQIVTAVADMCYERSSWAELETRLPAVAQQENIREVTDQ